VTNQRYGWEENFICVEDPFELDFNLSRLVKQQAFQKILIEFQDAYVKLCYHPNDIHSLWEEENY
jgi:hypothetical protein